MKRTVIKKMLLLLLVLCFAWVSVGAVNLSKGNDDEGKEAAAETAWEPELVFSTVDSDGQEWTDSCFRDASLTMLNLWAYWCPPCVGELPDLQKLSEDYAEQGFRILGVSLEDYEQDNLQTMQELGVTYPCLRLTEELDEVLSTGYVPTSIFINQEGKIVSEAIVGSRSYDDWAEMIEELLG